MRLFEVTFTSYHGVDISNEGIYVFPTLKQAKEKLKDLLLTYEGPITFYNLISYTVPYTKKGIIACIERKAYQINRRDILVGADVDRASYYLAYKRQPR